MISKRDARRARRAIENIPLGKVLAQFRYHIDPNSPREQQFQCDLHGVDHKPSARFYPQTNSTYCWVCHKSRDPIDYYREKEGVGFTQALDLLERAFHLEPLPWEEEDLTPEFVLPEFKGRTPLEALESSLMLITKERFLDMDTTLSFWALYDNLHLRADQEKAIEVLSLVHKRVANRLSE